MYNLRIKRIVFAATLVFALLFILYAFSHGRITLNNQQSVNYEQSSGLLSESITASSSSKTVSSGKYSALVTDPAGNASVVLFTARHFLLPTPLTAQSSNHLLTVSGRLTNDSLAFQGSQLVSYNNTTIHTLTSSNINGSREDDETYQAPDFSSSIQIGSSQVAGMVTVDGGVQPELYDFSTETITYYPLISTTDPGSISLQPAGSHFSLFDKYRQVLYAYGNTAADVNVVTLSNTKNLAFHNQTMPVVSYSSGDVAVVTGDSSTDAADGTNNSASTSHRSVLQILNTASKQAILSLNINSSPVTNVTFSNDAKYLLIQTPLQAVIYNVATKKATFRFPFALTSFVWGNNDDFAFISSGNNLFAGSVIDQQVNSVVAKSTLTPTRISFLQDKKLYFSGFQTYSTGNEYPDAYTYDLARPSAEISKKIISVLPHQGSNFYVDSIGTNIIVQTTRYITDDGTTIDTKAQEAGDDYAKQLIGSDQTYKIVHTYIDSDLRD